MHASTAIYVVLALFTKGFQLVSGDRVPLVPPTTYVRTNTLNERVVVSLPGGISTCYIVNLDIQGITFSVMIDSGSTDLTIPLAGLNNYSGPTINTPRPPGGSNLTGAYGDQSGWIGYGFQGTARVTGTNITTSNAPVIGMFQQTTNPIYTTGDVTQGLLGIAYPSLASYRVTPSTVVDAWVASGTMPKNEIAFHACPYSMTNQSYVDFGNDDPSYKCSSNGVPVVWAYSPARTYFTIDVRAISIDSVPVTLPQTFQNGIGYNKWSLVDSCTSVMILPGSVITALVNAIQSSGGLPSDLASSPHLSNFLSGSIGIRPVQPFQWSKLPSISFDITSDQIRPGGQNATFKITLGARQYIQPNANGYFAMIARSGGERYANLGIPLFSNLNVVLDRANARVGFSQGCGCDTATDGYPIIQDANGRVWKAGVSTSSTSSASSTPAAATQTTSRRVSQTSTTSSTTRIIRTSVTPTPSRTVTPVTTIFITPTPSSIVSACPPNPSSPPTPVYSPLYIPGAQCTIGVGTDAILIPNSCLDTFGSSSAQPKLLTLLHSTSSGNETIQRGVTSGASHVFLAPNAIIMSVCLAALVGAYIL